MNFQKKPVPDTDSGVRTVSNPPLTKSPSSEIPTELCLLHEVLENLEATVKSLTERLDPVLYYAPQETNISKEDAPPRKTKCGQQIYDATTRIRQLLTHLSTINESLEI